MLQGPSSRRLATWGAVIVSVLIVVGYFTVIWAIFVTSKQFNEREATILNQLFGVLTAGFISVSQYWLGSSSGSAAKDARLEAAERERSAILPQAPPSPARPPSPASPSTVPPPPDPSGRPG